MRLFSTFAVFLLPLSALRADTFVFVSKEPERHIQTYRLDPRDGSLTAQEEITVGGSPVPLATDPQKRFLFVGLRNDKALASFRIDSATGKLRTLSTVPSDANDSYLGTDRTGRWLFSACYNEASVVVHEVTGDGRIRTPPVQTLATVRTTHSAVTDSSNRFVFVPHVTPNAIFQFHLDAATGRLTAAGRAAGGTANAGPRHLAFHPSLPLAFTSDEQGNSITAYRFEPAMGLKPVQTLSTLPGSFRGRNSTADVKVHPSGKFVWVSNRGHDSLAGFAIDSAGKLTSLGQTATEKTPTSFDLDASGRFLFVAGSGSGKVAVYQIDARTGKLTRRHTYAAGNKPAWLLVVDYGDN